MARRLWIRASGLLGSVHTVMSSSCFGTAEFCWTKGMEMASDGLATADDGKDDGEGK
jgi:hypothetical protein